MKSSPNFRLKNPFKSDPFLRTSVVWGLGLLCMILVADFAGRQLNAYDARIGQLIPYGVVLFGAAYMVRFIGVRPVYHTALCGVTVGVSLALLGLISELLGFRGIFFESFARFAWVALFQGALMGLIGGAAGWVMTRGRVPIEIEMPTKKDEEEARKKGESLPAPRIVTPLAAMPGSPEKNAALLEQLEKDPTSLMSERERHKLARKAASKSKRTSTDTE